MEVASSCCCTFFGKKSLCRLKVCTLHGEKQEAVEGHFHRKTMLKRTFPFFGGNCAKNSCMNLNEVWVGNANLYLF